MYWEYILIIHLEFKISCCVLYLIYVLKVNTSTAVCKKEETKKTVNEQKI